MAIVKRERWTEEEVMALPPGEHNFLERKAGALLANSGFRQDMAKALSALANSGGGHLILGMRDDGSFDGVPEFKGRQPVREWLEQVLPELLDYPLQDFRVHEVESATPSAIPPGNIAIVIDVGDSTLAPHQSSSAKIYYYRVGGHSLPAPHFYLETLRGRDKFPGPTVVRAWFETVLNPLIHTLRSEQAYLSAGRWTWKSYPQGLVEVTCLGSPQPPFYVSENQEQFLEQQPVIRTVLGEHDEAVDAFKTHIAELHEAVMTSPELENVYRDMTTPESLQALRDAYHDKLRECQDAAAIMRDLFVGSDAVSHLDVLARHVVNNESDLQVGYITTAPLWNTHRQEFLSVLAAPELAARKEQLERSKERLEVAVANLLDQLTETRRGLARRYNVPYAEPVRSGTARWPDKY